MNKINILLVDDRKENLLALQSLLRNEDTELFLARTGMEALEHLLLREFALAIIDVQMPEMDGFELAELMRGTEQTRSVPIIFVTAGEHSRQSTFRGYEKGAVDFLYKPLDAHVVKSKVQVFIDLARQRNLLQVQLQETQRALSERDRALAEARDALRTRDEFMSIASHELKTPLTSLYLQIQLLVRTIRKRVGAKDQPIADSLNQRFLDSMGSGLELCQRQSERLTELLNELLDLTRVRLGQLQLTKTEVNLTALTRQTVDTFKSEIEPKGESIDVNVISDPGFGHWDQSRIQQILTNLVSNAVKYGNGAPISIRIKRFKAIGADGLGARECACFEIEDQGIGIAPDLQKKIFERFERAVRDGSISGLGLGLYITRQIVEAHGGSVSVKSELGVGSVFTVILPLSIEPKTMEDVTTASRVLQ